MNADDDPPDENLDLNPFTMEYNEDIFKKEGNSNEDIKQQFPCEQCDYVGTKRRYIVRHNMRVHGKKLERKKAVRKKESKGEKKQWSCPECDYVSGNRFRVRTHAMDVHEIVMPTLKRGFLKTKNELPTTRHSCDLCSKVFPMASRLRDHKLFAHEGITFDCTLCDFKGSRPALSRHKRRVHDQRYKCDQCEFNGSSLEYLKEHKQSKHLGIRYNCEHYDCKSAFASLRNLKVHIKEKHEEKTLLCDQCHFTTNTNSILQTHVNAVHLQKYFCELCQVLFPTSRAIDSHMENKHTDGPKLKKIQSLKKQSNIKKYMCDKCPFKTDWYPHLQTHMDNLHGTKVFSCDLCDYTTLLPKEFKRHWGYRHDPNTKRFPCDQCHYSATFVHALKTHMQIVHEGIRYPCDLCDYKATKREDVIKHKNTIHEKIRVPCEFCLQTYSSEGALRTHKKSKHPDEYVKYARLKKRQM